jgi:hypothetical protein
LIRSRRRYRPARDGLGTERTTHARVHHRRTRATSPDVASTAEAVREGLDPEAGPGAADATPASTASGSAPPAGRSDSPTGDPPDPADGRAGGTAGSAAGPDASADPTSEPAAGPSGADDGLPDDLTAGTRSTGDDRAGSGAASDSPDRPASHARRGAPQGDAPASPTDLDAGAVGEWLAGTEFAYGFDATLSLDGRTTRHRMASDDVGETFEPLVTWFADAAGGDTATEDALGILLAGMDTAPRLPPNAVLSAFAGLGLSRDDSVEDVLAALEEANGLRLE